MKYTLSLLTVAMTLAAARPAQSITTGQDPAIGTNMARDIIAFYSHDGKSPSNSTTSSASGVPQRYYRVTLFPQNP